MERKSKSVLRRVTRQSAKYLKCNLTLENLKHECKQLQNRSVLLTKIPYIVIDDLSTTKFKLLHKKYLIAKQKQYLDKHNIVQNVSSDNTSVLNDDLNSTISKKIDINNNIPLELDKITIDTNIKKPECSPNSKIIEQATDTRLQINTDEVIRKTKRLRNSNNIKAKKITKKNDIAYRKKQKQTAVIIASSKGIDIEHFHIAQEFQMKKQQILNYSNEKLESTNIIFTNQISQQNNSQKIDNENKSLLTSPNKSKKEIDSKSHINVNTIRYFKKENINNENTEDLINDTKVSNYSDFKAESLCDNPIYKKQLTDKNALNSLDKHNDSRDSKNIKQPTKMKREKVTIHKPVSCYNIDKFAKNVKEQSHVIKHNNFDSNTSVKVKMIHEVEIKPSTNTLQSSVNEEPVVNKSYDINNKRTKLKESIQVKKSIIKRKLPKVIEDSIVCDSAVTLIKNKHVDNAFHQNGFVKDPPTENESAVFALTSDNLHIFNERENNNSSFQNKLDYYFTCNDKQQSTNTHSSINMLNNTRISQKKVSHYSISNQSMPFKRKQECIENEPIILADKTNDKKLKLNREQIFMLGINKYNDFPLTCNLPVNVAAETVATNNSITSNKSITSNCNSHLQQHKQAEENVYEDTNDDCLSLYTESLKTESLNSIVDLKPEQHQSFDSSNNFSLNTDALNIYMQETQNEFDEEYNKTCDIRNLNFSMKSNEMKYKAVTSTVNNLMTNKMQVNTTIINDKNANDDFNYMNMKNLQKATQISQTTCRQNIQPFQRNISFLGYCFTMLKRGICNRRLCKFSHNLQKCINDFSTNDASIEAVIDHACQVGYQHFVYKAYCESRFLSGGSILRIYRRICEAGFVNEVIASRTITVLSQKGIDLKFIIDYVIVILYLYDTQAAKSIKELILRGLNSNILSNVFRYCTTMVQAVEALLVDCINIQQYVQDVYENVITNLQSNVIVNLNKNLMLKFTQLYHDSSSRKSIDIKIKSTQEKSQSNLLLSKLPQLCVGCSDQLNTFFKNLLSLQETLKQEDYDYLIHMLDTYKKTDKPLYEQLLVLNMIKLRRY